VKELLLMETSWYTSPEEIAGAPCSCASDIYRLGVLLFEVCKHVVISLLRIFITIFALEYQAPFLFPRTYGQHEKD